VKNVVVSALAIAALAGSAFAQDAVRLELRLVSQMGTPSNPASPVTSQDVLTHTDTTSGIGVARRFEVQYRIVDLNDGDTIVPAGLTAGSLRLVATGGTLEKAILSRQEARNPSAGTPALIPVSQSVNLDTDNYIISGAAGSPWRGMHQPFRGGFNPTSDNNQASNGTLSPDSMTLSGIVPLVLVQTDQNDGGWYGLYSFNFLPTAGSGTVMVSFDADTTTGNRFGYFNDGNPAPLNSGNATTDSANILVPAPGAFALLGLGGLLANRRRRA
jgi:hypothetical protein